MSRKAAWANPAKIDAVAEPDPQWFCSSDDFKRMLYQNHPNLLVPEREIVYVGEGIPSWTPDREQPHPGNESCPDYDTIRPGSRLCCPHCHLSGFESKLADQRRLSGFPPPEREQRKAPAKSVPAPCPALPATSDPKKRQWWARLAWSKPQPSPSKKRSA